MQPLNCHLVKSYIRRYNPSVLQISNPPCSVVPDPAEYIAALKRKMCDLQELIDSNIVHSAEGQQFYKSSTPEQLNVGQQVCNVSTCTLSENHTN